MMPEFMYMNISLEEYDLVSLPDSDKMTKQFFGDLGSLHPCAMQRGERTEA